MSNRFWRLESPAYDSDYQHTYINGDFDRRHGMPGINCSECGQTWSDSRVMPFPCPTSLRDHPNLLVRWPIKSDAHRKLREQVLNELRRDGFADNLTEEAVRGGFMGGSLKVPSRPRADFLWGTLGSLIVSNRLRDVLLNAAPAAVSAGPIILAKIGRGDARFAPKTSGEPEDLVEELAVERPDSEVGQYFEIVVFRESARPPGAEVIGKCLECGREEIDKTRRRLVIQPQMWRGDPIFVLATTLWVVVTDEIRDKLVKMKATNVKFVPVATPEAS